MTTTFKPQKVVLVGYSGHAFVVAETLMQIGFEVVGYLEKVEVASNPFNISYLGFEQNLYDLEKIKDFMIFPSIGDNFIREKVMSKLERSSFVIPIAIHPQANISTQIKLGDGTLICRGACINPFSVIGKGVIINTAAIVEHECIIGDYAHIAPGAVLAGNVKIGNGSFVGANAVVKQGVEIGKNVIIGAGAVILKDVPDNLIMVGNPAKIIVK